MFFVTDLSLVIKLRQNKVQYKQVTLLLTFDIRNVLVYICKFNLAKGVEKKF